MFVQSIDLKNVYNFGRNGTKELCDFKTFNVFIGKNGSGKSNVFRALSNLDVLACYSEHTETFQYLLSNSTVRRTNHQTHLLSSSGVTIPQEHHSNIDIVLDGHEIIFRDGQHIRGNFMSHKALHIDYEVPGLNFESKLRKLCLENKLNSVLLSFAVSYIFQLDFRFQRNGRNVGESFSKQGNTNGGHVGRPIILNQWSSGFFFTSNLLIELLATKHSVICIDEPETHLEPRVLRRLLNIIFWLFANKEVDGSRGIDKLIQYMNQQWSSWLLNNPSYLASSEWKDDHPNNYIGFTRKSSDEFPKQIFLSSHSSILINEFMQYPEICGIYLFRRKYVDNSWDETLLSKNVQEKTLISQVYRVENSVDQIQTLDELGVKGSDLLQTNGIVWVEGPSDVIYIKKWLELYVFQNNLMPLVQGLHYEFQMFGGTLLDSLCYQKEIGITNEFKKIVSMFSFSRNAFVVTDSDSVLKNGKVVDQSNFCQAKKYIAQEFDLLRKSGCKVGVWYKENCTDVRTLEDYLDDETRLLCKKRESESKKKYATRVTNRWSNQKSIYDFRFSLAEEVAKLHSLICEWNEL